MVMSREKCITCEEDTPYHFSTDIEYRSHYIEGAGQLCESCWDDCFEDKSNK
jgi:hypothetical protein